MIENIVCPLLSNLFEKDSKESIKSLPDGMKACIGSQCAWYDQAHYTCVLVVIKTMLERIMTILEGEKIKNGLIK